MTSVKRTIPKNILTRRRKYFNSIRSQLKHTLFVRGELVCAVCGAKEDLELHHIIPLAMGGNNNIDNIMVLCHKHHVEMHREMCKKTKEMTE
jgi:5-methylcytosine-specific restriction endonuclease McrA